MQAHHTITNATTAGGHPGYRCIAESRGLRGRAYARSFGGAVCAARDRLARRIRTALAQRRAARAGEPRTYTAPDVAQGRERGRVFVCGCGSTCAGCGFWQVVAEREGR